MTTLQKVLGGFSVSCGLMAAIYASPWVALTFHPMLDQHLVDAFSPKIADFGAWLFVACLFVGIAYAVASIIHASVLLAGVLFRGG